MHLLSLRLLLAAVLLYAAGYLGNIAFVGFELLRVAAFVCLTAGVLLLVVATLRPAPKDAR